MIVIAFGLDVQAYLENEAHKKCPRPEQCRHCQAVGRMVGHGSYQRKPKGVACAWFIRVRRWRCQVCHRTVSCLPNFLLSFRHYPVSIIQTVLSLRLEQEGSWSEAVARCS